MSVHQIVTSGCYNLIMSNEVEQEKSLVQQAKDWFLGLVGLDEESRAARDEYITDQAINRVIEDYPELVEQHLGIEGVGRDQTLDAATKERAYAALANLGDHDVIGAEVADFGPADPAYTAGLSRSNDDFFPGG